jgi:hypothetical protein
MRILSFRKKKPGIGIRVFLTAFFLLLPKAVRSAKAAKKNHT